MAKNKTPTSSGMVEIRNLQDGPRTFALSDGTGLHLAGRHKGAVFPVIRKEQVNAILERARSKGLIEIVEVEGGDLNGSGNAESNMD